MEEPLADWVRAHHVCWDVAPSRRPGEGGHPGFELTLLALCGSRRGIDPARPECHATYERLAAIAARALPAAVPHHVEPYDAAVHLRPESAFAPEVELIVEAFPDPADAQGVRASMEEALRRLGVKAKTWSEAAAAR